MFVKITLKIMSVNYALFTFAYEDSVGELFQFAAGASPVFVTYARSAADATLVFIKRLIRDGRSAGTCWVAGISTTLS